MNSISDKKEKNIKLLLLQWETILILIFIVLTIINSLLSQYYLNFKLLITATSVFMDKALIALPLAFILIAGEIDISLASSLALSSVVMGETYSKGVPMGYAIIICLLVATLCGFINGLIVIKFKELSSVIITLSTMIIFRGITYTILKDEARGGFPTWFSAFGWSDIWGIPYSFLVFIFFAILFGILLHKTTFGRKVYSIGANKVASLYSGVRINRIKLILFTFTGFMIGVASLVLTSRLGSTRPNIAFGYELDIITIVILGGVSPYGGKGKMGGVIISIFLIGYLRYGLGLVNVNSQIFLLIIGALLILAVLLPNMFRNVKYKNI